ncbi:hypothetical protein BKA59DRAFT_488949 [Fusarium tricinctum]|uniref:NACHT domain-containing protein n=1 Tax=Fusarium tricinctum TaxID=61284 RepID=A0A8K0S6C2_9HYPO|nr:hypothetical protein BKA59DRAFT_488949 [Fusarium tricinctum]
MSTLLERIVPLKPEIRLAQAIKQFEMDLSDEQKAAFDSNKRQSSHSPPDIHDVMRLTAEIDRRVAGKVGGGRCFGTRIVNVLEAMLVNVSSWFDKLSELFMNVGRSAPRYQAIALLYPRSKKLQSHLSEYFLVVVRICHDLLKLTQKSMFAQLVSFMTESDMKQSRHLVSISKTSEAESYRKKLEDRHRILDSCSTYDYQTTWKEIRRCGNTSCESCILLYSGKLGSGKSISLANMIDDLNLHRQDSPPVAYFFCQHDAPESLRARTILGALARQLLYTIEEPTTMSEDFTLSGPPVLDYEGILRLLKRTLNPTCRAYFVLDGLDECDINQKEDVISYLRKIQTVCPLLICLSFRQEAGKLPALHLETFAKPSMISIPENNPDIAEFIQAELERRVGFGRLRVGEPTLTDESICHALADLLRDLPDTFSRILEQSAALGKEDQRRTLKLITAACRPLITDELREALSVVPGDPDWNPSRMLNDVYAALACCGSLVIVDEETLSVKLIYHSVKQFLLIPQVRHGAVPMKKLALRLLKYQEPSNINISKLIAREVQRSKVYWAHHILRDSKQDQAIYRYLCRALDRNVLVVDARDDGGRTPLSRTAEGGHKAVVRLLLEKGADIESNDGDGRKALSWAAQKGQEAVVRLLLEKGADIESRDRSDRTALLWAAQEGYEDAVRLLLEKGADIEHPRFLVPERDQDFY